MTPLQKQLIEELYNQSENIPQTLDKLSETDKKFTDEDGNSPLHIACFLKNEKLIKLLLKNGFGNSLYTENAKGLIPLHILCIRDAQKLNPKLAYLKIFSHSTSEKPAFSNTDPYYFPPVEFEQEEVAQVASENIMALKSPQKSKEIISLLSREARLIYCLLRYEIIHSESYDQLKLSYHSTLSQQEGTALHLACKYFGKDMTVIAVMLADIEQYNIIEEALLAKDSFKQTPLHIAARYGSAEVIRILLEEILKIYQDNEEDIRMLLEEVLKAYQNKEEDVRQSDIASKDTFIASKDIFKVNLAKLIDAAAFNVFAAQNILFPSLGRVTEKSGFLLQAASYNSPITRMRIYGALHLTLEGDLNLLHLIAKHNDSSVMRQFCKEMPATLLYAWAGEETGKATALKKIIDERNRKNPREYSLSKEQFIILMKQESCFLSGLNYFIEKRKEIDEKGKHITDKLAKNFKVRIKDFCQIIETMTQFFIEKQGKLMGEIEEAFKKTLTDYQRRSSALVVQIDETKSFFSTDRYKTYRERLLKLDTDLLIRRFNEFCITVFLPPSTDNDRHTQAVISELRQAFIKGGYKVEEIQPANEPVLKKEPEEEIIIIESPQSLSQ